MSKINRIVSLRDYGIFRNFSWPNDLPEFGRYNLIYGWNGTGKTTLSRLLRDLERRAVPTMGEVRVRIGGRDLRGSEFLDSTLQIRVFNRDFIQESVFPVGGGDLPPIYVLGEESVEKQKEVERLKSTLAEEQSKLESERSTAERCKRDLEQFCIDRAKLIKDMLRSSGTNRFNNYNKSDFRDDTEEMIKAGNASTYALGEDEREKLLVQHRAVPKPKVREVAYAPPDFDAIIERVSELLSTTVVSAAIEALKNDPTLAQWVHQGLELHQERESSQCLFCEQPLPKGRMAALEAHFSDQYQTLINRIDEMIKELEAESSKVDGLRLPHKTEVYEDLTEEFEAAETELREAFRKIQRFIEDMVKVLKEKKNKLFEPFKPKFEKPHIDSGIVEKLNTVIRMHNQACDDFQARVNEARERLARDMIVKVLPKYIRRRDEVKAAEDKVKNLREKIRRLSAEIAKLEQEIIEHRRPADELNEDLRKYLGHDELRLEIKDTGYTITRGGEPARALSEGEMTAIALLYFLKSLQDKEFDLSDGVVVLDDPVSSLDANALFLAFGFIRERTKEAGQLFILTHNFSFFRQVRNWFHHMKGQRKKDVNQRPARFYMLDCACDQNGRYTSIRWLDPLIEQYDSEYHYLFARVHRASTETDSTGLEQKYVLPNMARRLLEAFLAFRKPQLSGELWQKMQAVQFDEAKKLRILRFLHTHSHSCGVGEPEHDPSVLAEGASVLRDLMELIRSQDPEHYSAMVKLVTTPLNGEDECKEVVKV